jgi:hypothetical protein
VIKSGESAVVDAPAALCPAIARLIARCVLADARRPEQDDILATLDEAELVQAFDLLAPERWLKREVEVAQLLDDRQAAGEHRRLQPTVIA